MPPLPEPSPAQLKRFDVPVPRYTSYPTVPEWSDAIGPEEHQLALERASHRALEPLSLYVHIPFCSKLCLYCGCNVVVAPEPAAADPYLRDLAREAELAARALGARRQVARLHWGGGTPTFLDPPRLRRLWDILAERFAFPPGAELAIEIDPAVTSQAQLELLAELGFNRLSLGVQDFDRAVQGAIGRHQDFASTGELLRSARELGFRSINLDLIYGLPRQTESSWRTTLERVRELGPDRIALFSFALVPSARPHQRKLPLADLPAPSAKLALFRAAYEALTDAGYRAIGMDHFALPGDELARAQEQRVLARDFQGYTTRGALDSVALGITGISDVAGSFTQTHRSRSVYHGALAEGGFATERGLRLTPEDQRRRAIITSLMCNFWVDLGGAAAEEFRDELKDLTDAEREGLIRSSGNELSVTPLGRLFVRNIASIFDTHLRRRRGSELPVYSRSV